MATMLVQHHVKDYAAWKSVFDSMADLRVSNGEVSHKIYRDSIDPNKLTVFNTWDTLEKAKKFAQSDELKAAMGKAGVEGAPTISFLKEA
ncbi:MAG: cyclase [Anaerolineales bacterium]